MLPMLLMLLPAIFAPAAAEIAGDNPAWGLAARFGETAGSVYGIADRQVIAPSRRAVARLLADPLMLTLWSRANRAAQGVAALAQGFILGPVARQSAALLDGPELPRAYRAVAAMTHSAEIGRAHV